MEILDMFFGGIPLAVLIIVSGLPYGVHAVWNDWREQRAFGKEFDSNMKTFKEEHEWKPYIVDGVDCGEWVRKDGRPYGIRVSR